MKNLVLSQCLGVGDILMFFCQVLFFLAFLNLLLLLKLIMEDAKDWFYVVMALFVIGVLLLAILGTALVSVNLMIVEIIVTIVGLLIMIHKKIVNIRNYKTFSQSFNKGISLVMWLTFLLFSFSLPLANLEHISILRAVLFSDAYA